MMLLKPEDSIAYQNAIGSDIMMVLDDVVSATSLDDARFKEAPELFIAGLLNTAEFIGVISKFCELEFHQKFGVLRRSERPKKHLANLHQTR